MWLRVNAQMVTTASSRLDYAEGVLGMMVGGLMHVVYGVRRVLMGGFPLLLINLKRMGENVRHFTVTSF